MRALTQATFERLHRRLEEVAAGVAAAYGCSVTNVSWSEVPYPPTVVSVMPANLYKTRRAGNPF